MQSKAIINSGMSIRNLDFNSISDFTDGKKASLSVDYDEMVSPLVSRSLSMEKERVARRRMSELLGKQGEINEILVNENEQLAAQQKTLLKLLTTKDKQLDYITASFQSIHPTDASSDRRITVPVAVAFFSVEKILKNRVRMAFKEIEKFKWRQMKEIQFNLGVCILEMRVMKCVRKKHFYGFRALCAPGKGGLQLSRVLGNVVRRRTANALYTLIVNSYRRDSYRSQIESKWNRIGRTIGRLKSRDCFGHWKKMTNRKPDFKVFCSILNKISFKRTYSALYSICKDYKIKEAITQILSANTIFNILEEKQRV